MIPRAAAYLGVLAVSPLHRRAGVARALTDECIERAHRDGAEEIWLVTSVLMPAARALYEGLGFARQDETTLYDHRYWSYSKPIRVGS
jgi:ribosomal protein S18 acetylase RimI-like enzyme